MCWNSFEFATRQIAQPTGASLREWQELLIGLGSAFGDLGDGSKTQVFALDCRLSGTRGSSVTGRLCVFSYRVTGIRQGLRSNW